MKYAIIKVVNGNYFVHAEGITKLDDAKTQFHGLCQVLWNAPDAYSACISIVDENLDPVNGYMGIYKEYITQPMPETTEE